MARNSDPFGFLAAIQTDHLTPAQLDAVNAIFDKPTDQTQEA